MNTAIVVDVSNLYYVIGKKYEAKKLDYAKYLKACEPFGDIYRAIAYGEYKDDKSNSFIGALLQMGFVTKFRERKQYRNNCSIGMALDAVSMINRIDTLIIGSSDPELVPLIHWVNARGISTIVFSSCIVAELKTACDRYIEIPADLLE